MNGPRANRMKSKRGGEKIKKTEQVKPVASVFDVVIRERPCPALMMLVGVNNKITTFLILS